MMPVTCLPEARAAWAATWSGFFQDLAEDRRGRLLRCGRGREAVHGTCRYSSVSAGFSK